MIRTATKISVIVVLFSVLPTMPVSANSIFNDAISPGGHWSDWQALLNQPIAFSVKRGEPYDESKDPALRRGAENSEQPQMDFFIMPIALFVGMGLFLFYNKL